MKKSLFVILFVFTSNTQSFSFGKLTYYSCNNYQDAISCNKNCKSLEVQGEYKVNEKSNVVMEIQYENNKIGGSHTYDDCQIVDKNNWSCKRTVINGFHQQEIKMINGKILNEHYYPRTSKRHYMCGR